MNARLNFDPVFEKLLPADDGGNEARYLLPGNLAPSREHVVDWFYDSPVSIEKWATTTEVWTDGAIIFRHHKAADGNHPYRFGYVRLEVV